jgi:hypothetical protein
MIIGENRRSRKLALFLRRRASQDLHYDLVKSFARVTQPENNRIVFTRFDSSNRGIAASFQMAFGAIPWSFPLGESAHQTRCEVIQRRSA